MGNSEHVTLVSNPLELRAGKVRIRHSIKFHSKQRDAKFNVARDSRSHDKTENFTLAASAHLIKVYNFVAPHKSQLPKVCLFRL